MCWIMDQDSLSYKERFQLYQKRKAFVEEHNSKSGNLVQVQPS